MFTWICPQCGKEVPPHETECPYCKEAAAKPPEEPKAAAPAPQPQQQAQPPQQPVYHIGATKRRGVPGWLITILVAGGLVGGAYLVYKYALERPHGTQMATSESPFEEVPMAEEGGEAAGGANRLNKYIEATGFRITEDQNKRLLLQFLVVNHSEADIGDLTGKVRVKTVEGDKEIASVDFKTSRLGPWESVEFKAVMSTMLRAYEVPDWQFLKGEVEITSPANVSPANVSSANAQ
jgi:hypothetical protein